MKNKVKEYREKLGMTQEDLALKSNVSRPTISMIENHVVDNIESNTMLKIAKALNKDIGDIFFSEVVVFTKQKEKEE